VHAVIQHADTQEQGTGDKTVGEHLQQCAFHAVGVEDEQPQRHKAHV
jgi:hypothetical protein